MRPTGIGILCGTAALSLCLVHAEAQESMTPAAPAPSRAAAAPATDPGLLTGPATVAKHWSKYQYPESIPEGASYYIVVRGDTLWDISKRFLNTPYLWPQIWDRNRYITDAHWIYPGDPLILPTVAVVGEAGGTGTGTEDTEGPLTTGPGGPITPADVLYPAIDEMALQCAQHIADGPEDESLRLIGAEQSTKQAFAALDIVYLGKGSSSGVKAGDVYTIQHATYVVKHPETRKAIGTKIETLGWLRVILVQENTATAEIEESCNDIHLGDYLMPYERVSVPLIVRRPPPDRLTPPSGKIVGTVVDMAEDMMITGQGNLLSINLGTANGIAPGSMLTVYKVMYPSVPTPRNVIGELAVVAVRERTATAKVIYSNDAIMNGDKVELR
ncbi:MAG: LysM peptidoglycan-binding domain-containing protein [bacterium]